MTKSDEFKKLKPTLEKIALGVAHQFGSNCEVAVHNLTKGYHGTIEFIENGNITGRKVGDDGSEVVLEALKTKDIEDHYSYITYAKDGHMLKSSTINIKGESGDNIAVLSINYDISDLTVATKILSDYVSAESNVNDNQTIITDDVSELLDQLIEESMRYIGKPVSAMTKDDKIKALKYLDKKGALLIKKSSDAIASFYGISKYTLYNYLGNGGDDN